MLDKPITQHGSYGLVCGLQYERYFSRELTYEKSAILPLFRKYPDAQIAWSGPWIIDLRSELKYREELLELSLKLPSVSWIKSENDIDTLAGHLARQLNVKLEDGRTALFRFYDPRVMHRVKDVLLPLQVEEILRGVSEWRYSLEGKDYIFSLNVKEKVA